MRQLTLNDARTLLLQRSMRKAIRHARAEKAEAEVTRLAALTPQGNWPIP